MLLPAMQTLFFKQQLLTLIHGSWPLVVVVVVGSGGGGGHGHSELELKAWCTFVPRRIFSNEMRDYIGDKINFNVEKLM